MEVNEMGHNGFEVTYTETGPGLSGPSLEPYPLFLRERARVRGQKVHVALDLVIEISFPVPEERDRHYKKTLDARHGVREYWVVDPEAKTVEVFALGEEGFQLVKAYKTGEALSSPLERNTRFIF